ncbi:hypothetical protein CQ017_08650 [Arthrobacter sp. MYb224]|uniref:FAD/NAD(P)-binding protein n=1 Tax=Arthrobacter sp. MYb224 TaxID=1848600 RepID=UPI000CFAB172|nr:FAD/NAD(P)-binding protein [Arthrobacter sp. MYb224]PQZ98614.1 hypothetical protein CQ017_08650 [Arthrobacter sp. MYb224]
MSNFWEEPQPQYNVAIVGAGPRGTSVIERLAKLAVKVPKLATLVRVTVFDPYRPGSGHVWNPKQSLHFLMNTPASFPTVAPERVAAEPGLSFRQFVEANGDGLRLEERQAAALRATQPGTYPPRAIYGRYLEHVYDSCARVLDEHPNFVLNYIRAEVLAVRPQEAGYRLDYRSFAQGDPGAGHLEFDSVVLALGHQDAELNPWQKQLQRAAEQDGATYLPPNIPADVDYSNFKSGESALLRGMGLNFFDGMAELTSGRGGIFKEVSQEPGHRFEYIASGKEPKLIAASRRGTPYWGKPVVEEFIPAEITLRFLHAEELIGKVAEARHSNPDAALSFSRHIWPQLHRDILWVYYSKCVATEAAGPTADSSWLLAGLERILEAEHHEGNQVWLSELRDYIDQFPHLKWLDIPALARPFDQVGFGSHEQYQQAVRDYLVGNAQHSSAGLRDPLSCAIMTMNAGRMVIKDLVTKGILDEQSRIEEVQAHFEPLVEGLSSGPPLERIEQLLALSRAGLVSFIGPEPEFGFDDVRGKFTVSSPWVDTEIYGAKVLCEAMMPSNRVLQNNTPLITQLLADKVARAHTWRNAEGEQMTGSGFDVVGEPYRLINAEGLAHRGIFVLGLQLSSAQWGTAIAAQAGDPTHPAAQTLHDAEQVVIEIARMAGVNLEELLAGSSK